MIGKRIKEARQEAGLTREQLAVKAGLTSLTIWKLESAGGGNPLLSTIQAIADALGKPITWFLAEEGQP